MTEGGSYQKFSLATMPNVKPHILRWARETAGLTPQDAVKKLAISNARGISAVDRLAALEAGRDSPSRPMLVKMAKKYRRPLIMFYLNDIPRKGDRGEDFRTLPDPVEEVEAGLVDAVVRDIRVRQDLVRAGLEASGEATRLSFIGSMTLRHGVSALVDSIEKILDFNRDEFRRKTRMQESFAYLRALTEATGIFVLLVDNLGNWHTTISVEAFRGFALADEVAPFVAVNANDSPGAWSFTLLHELAHLWIGTTGVSGGTGERAIEKFCNDVSSEILLPRNELGHLDISEETPFELAISQITEFAKVRKVSSTMVAYRLHRAGAYGLAQYERFKEYYWQAFLSQQALNKEKNAKNKNRPTYHIVRKHRVGTTLLRFVEQMMDEGNLSTTKAGKVLGVGAHNVYALLEKGYPKSSN